MKNLNVLCFFTLLFCFQTLVQAQTLMPRLVKKLNPNFSSHPFGFTNFNGSIYFFGTRSETRSDNIALWRTDGTEAGTLLVKDNIGFKTLGKLPEIKILGNQMLFLTYEFTNDSVYLNLWRSTGTEAGTTILRRSGGTFTEGTQNATGQMTLFNGRLYFNFFDDSGGSEPFSTNGTEAGTQILRDLQTVSSGSGSTPSFPHRFTVFQNSLYFWTIPFVTGTGLKARLYRTNGTSVGTVMVKEFDSGFGESTFLSHLVPFNGKLYFSAKSSGTSGYELWSTTGTEAFTQLVKEINPGTLNSGDGVSRIFNAQVFKNRLYFWAFDPASGHELWSTDGTSAGTTFLRNTNSSSIPTVNQQQYNSNPFFVWGGKMYYANNDGIRGREPWVTDGTVAGTRFYADVNPGAGGSIDLWNPSYTLFRNNLYFRAFDGSTTQVCMADTTNNTFSKLPVANGFFRAEVLFDIQRADDEHFAFHELNGQLYFPAGFHETSADPVDLSYDVFKLVPRPTLLPAQAQLMSMMLFPNPSQGQYFMFCESLTKPAKVSVVNSSGQSVWMSTIPIGQNKWQLDLRSKPNGIYVVKIETGGYARELKLIKHD